MKTHLPDVLLPGLIITNPKSLPQLPFPLGRIRPPSSGSSRREWRQQLCPRPRAAGILEILNFDLAGTVREKAATHEATGKLQNWTESPNQNSLLRRVRSGPQPRAWSPYPDLISLPPHGSWSICRNPPPWRGFGIPETQGAGPLASTRGRVGQLGILRENSSWGPSFSLPPWRSSLANRFKKGTFSADCWISKVYTPKRSHKDEQILLLLEETLRKPQKASKIFSKHHRIGIRGRSYRPE